MADDVPALLAALPDARRPDAEALTALMQEVTGAPPTLWFGSIIGFGSRHYRYATGREGDTVQVGFAPRASGPVLYLSDGVDEYEDLLARLGPSKRGKGCLYLKRLSDVDESVLRAIVDRSFRAGATDLDALA